MWQPCARAYSCHTAGCELTYLVEDSHIKWYRTLWSYLRLLCVFLPESGWTINSHFSRASDWGILLKLLAFSALISKRIILSLSWTLPITEAWPAPKLEHLAMVSVWIAPPCIQKYFSFKCEKYRERERENVHSPSADNLCLRTGLSYVEKLQGIPHFPPLKVL